MNIEYGNWLVPGTKVQSVIDASQIYTIASVDIKNNVVYYDMGGRDTLSTLLNHYTIYKPQKHKCPFCADKGLIARRLK